MTNRESEPQHTHQRGIEKTGLVFQNGDLLCPLLPVADKSAKIIQLRSSYVYVNDALIKISAQSLSYAGVNLPSQITVCIDPSSQKAHWDWLTTEVNADLACFSVYIDQSGALQIEDVRVRQPEQRLGYYNRFEAQDNYEQTLFCASKALQSAELNEVQQQAWRAQQHLASSLYQDGEVIQGQTPKIQGQVIVCSAHQVYLDGQVRRIAPAQCTVLDVQAPCELGVWLAYQVISAQEDGQLQDPAQHCANAGEEGASRLQAQLSWGTSEQTHKTGRFYPLYQVVQGGCFQRHLPLEHSLLKQKMAQQQQDFLGANCIIEGLEVSNVALNVSRTEQCLNYEVAPGRGFIQGVAVELPVTLEGEKTIFTHKEISIELSEQSVYVLGDEDTPFSRTGEVKYNPNAQEQDKYVMLGAGSYEIKGKSLHLKSRQALGAATHILVELNQTTARTDTLALCLQDFVTLKVHHGAPASLPQSCLALAQIHIDAQAKTQVELISAQKSLSELQAMLKALTKN